MVNCWSEGMEISGDWDCRTRGSVVGGGTEGVWKDLEGRPRRRNRGACANTAVLSSGLQRREGGRRWEA